MQNGFKISEDDIVINLRFKIVFTLDPVYISLAEAWITDTVKRGFKNYTQDNSIRINKIEFIGKESLVFDFKQINPDLSLEEIIVKMQDDIKELFPKVSNEEIDIIFKEVKIFSLGNQDEVKGEIRNYLRSLGCDE